MRNKENYLIPFLIYAVIFSFLFYILNVSTYIKEEPKTFIVPKEEMLIFKAGYFMGNEAGKNGYNVDSAWSVDSSFFYNKFFKLKTTNL